MADSKGSSTDPDVLRRRAEEQLRERAPHEALNRSVDTLRVLHDLEVHQIELEIQNDELRASRYEAEEAARRYTELYDFAPVGYATLDTDGMVRTVNFACANLLGLERARLAGRRFGAFVADHDLKAYLGFLERAGRGERRETCDLALRSGKEGSVQVHLTATLLDKPVPELLVAMEDVTERRRKEMELEEAFRLLNFSQHIAGLGTFTFELARGQWTSSAAVDEILGISAGWDRSLRGFFALVPLEDRQDLETYLRSEAPRGTPLNREFRVVNAKSGEVRWVWMRGDVEYDVLEPLRLVGTLQDITERKALQQERAKLLKETEAARAAAEEANRSKDAFLAALSHELRNPLTPINNSLVILERSQPGSELSHRALRTIDRQVHHLARLVDDLLDTTRIARGKVKLRKDRVDLNEIVKNLSEDHRPVFEANEVKLEVALAPRPVAVEGDWHRLGQVVGNLLQNAAKFCQREGNTRIAVSEDASEQQALVTVADDGVGIAPEVLGHLFEPFVQGDTTLARSKGGLGLGMALAKQLVELHGGQISARSGGVGRGAQFTVRLPLAPPTVAALRAPPSASSASLVRRRVLIIEDNVDAADTLRDLLELQQQEVAVAHNGSEGLELVHGFRPEIVLCDIGLPGMDGYEVARTIRAGRTPDCPYLVALSGYALPEDVRRASESGFDLHIPKPPSIEDLDRLLAEVPRRVAPSPTDRRPKGPL